MRKRRIPVKRYACKLHGGPYNGETVRLELGSNLYTLPFTARGMTGFYSRQDGVAGNVLHWTQHGSSAPVRP